jgi:hypothetical protein
MQSAQSNADHVLHAVADEPAPRYFFSRRTCGNASPSFHPAAGGRAARVWRSPDRHIRAQVRRPWLGRTPDVDRGVSGGSTPPCVAVWNTLRRTIFEACCRQHSSTRNAAVPRRSPLFTVVAAISFLLFLVLCVLWGSGYFYEEHPYKPGWTYWTNGFTIGGTFVKINHAVCLAGLLREWWVLVRIVPNMWRWLIERTYQRQLRKPRHCSRCGYDLRDARTMPGVWCGSRRQGRRRLILRGLRTGRAALRWHAPAAPADPSAQVDFLIRSIMSAVLSMIWG